MEQTKTCIKCKQTLDILQFNKRGGEKYLRTECKNCTNKARKIREELKNKFGLPPHDYCCPICKRKSEECAGQGGKNVSTWVIDHCHTTNKFRGWLCHKCNRAIGGFSDDIELLNNAINYLQNGV